jgi:Methyltransferase domain.
MCDDLQKMPSELFDVIIHNHVLEHICCSVEDTLVELNRILKKGGNHFFTVPFRGNETIEDISPSLTDEERIKLFGQHDHVRIFGKEDFPALLKKVWNVSDVTVSVKSLFSETEIERAAIPLKSLEEIDANTIFHQVK